jgi:hypothetical protein
MPQQELLKNLSACLEENGIPYMITGSIASSLHGEPRSTHDIDVIVQMKLRWAKLSGGSEKQFGDALHVYEVQQKGLDLPYVEHWVAALGLTDLWRRLKSEAQAFE